MKLSLITLSASIPASCLLILPAPLFANGYNKISMIGIPVIFILFALFYGVIAPVPAFAVYLADRCARRGRAPGFAPIYLGSFSGGEAGIGLCWYLRSILTVPGAWDSYHYTLYPWVVLGMSLAGAILALFIHLKRVTR